jgi:hypothetical protein
LVCRIAIGDFLHGTVTGAVLALVALPRRKTMREQDSYAEYELCEIEESITDLGGAPLCWKQGREYRHVGWLRVLGGNCRFWLYRDQEATLVAVQRESCEDCIASVRAEAARRSYGLVDLRKRASAAERDSCGASEARAGRRAYPSRSVLARAA